MKNEFGRRRNNIKSRNNSKNNSGRNTPSKTLPKKEENDLKK